MLLLPRALSFTLLVALGIVQSGCTAIRFSSTVDSVRPIQTTGGGREIGAYDQLKPDAPPGKKADMIMAGTHIPVNLSTRKIGTTFSILLSAHDEMFEKEMYRSSPESFSLIQANDDQYSPDLELIHFPMHVGDKWNWEGNVSSGGIRHNATAAVKSSSVTFYDNGVSNEAIRVDVDLSLFSDGIKNPAARKLVFEFVPGKGIVRREFGDASVREPIQP
jgi:hypothetical protein